MAAVAALTIGCCAGRAKSSATRAEERSQNTRFVALRSDYILSPDLGRKSRKSGLRRDPPLFIKAGSGGSTTTSANNRFLATIRSDNLPNALPRTAL